MTQTLVPTYSEAPASVEELALGTRIDRYVVLDRLGAGGMGVVYRAYDPDLDRNVALKLVRADQKNAERRQRLRDRLLKEAKALAQLSHPNVVTVHDVGTYRDDVFVAMELVAGKTLRHATDDKPCISKVIDLYSDAARGLAAAHAVGIVHRDFKPDNAIVDKDGIVHVLDFGLARAVRDENDDLSGGTPGYMAPEQLAGRDVDGRSDQYSFCVALYESLYDTIPPDAPNPPPRTSWGTRVPKRVRAALVRGLAEDPASRFPTMDTLIAALSPRPMQRIAIAGGAVALVAATAGLVMFLRTPNAQCEGFADRLDGIWDSARRAAVERNAGAAAVHLLDGYTAQWVAMHRASCNATVLGDQSHELLDLRSECLQHRLDEVKYLTNVLVAGSNPRAIQSIHELSAIDDCANATALRDPLPPRDIPRARALRARLAELRVAYSLGNFDDMKTGTAQLVTDAVAAGDRWLGASALYLRARALRDTGDTAGAEDQLFRAIELAESGRASEVAADAWITLAWIVGEDRGRTADALRFAGVARGVLERIGGSARLEAVLEDHLGVLYLDQGALQLARHHLERALSMRERAYGVSDANYAASLQHVALLEQASGNHDKALQLHTRAREITEGELGSTHPDVLAMIGGEAAALYELGRYADADALLEKTLPVAVSASGPESELVASLLTNLGLAQWKLGRLADSRSTFERALDIVERHAPGSPRAATIHLDLALVLIDSDQPDAAAPHADRAVTGYRQLGAEAEVANALDLLAKARASKASR